IDGYARAEGNAAREPGPGRQRHAGLLPRSRPRDRRARRPMAGARRADALHLLPRRHRVGHPVRRARRPALAHACQRRRGERGVPSAPRARELRRASDPAPAGPCPAGERRPHRARSGRAVLPAVDGRDDDRTRAAGPAGPALVRTRSGAAGGEPEPARGRARVVKKAIDFYSEGFKLVGDVYYPDGVKPGERRAGIVLCHGYTGVKDLYLPDNARVLNDAGYMVMTFDYKGWGDSEGPRSRLAPYSRVADVQAALTFLGTLPEVDS